MLLRFAMPQPVESAAKLDPIARAQVEAAGVRWDDQQLSAEARLAEWKGFCSYLKVYDGERHAFDAWFYLGESGTFFVAGTTEVVAQIAQSSVECDDPQVRAQLQRLLRGDSQ